MQLKLGLTPFMKAKTPRQVDRAVKKVIEQGLERIRVSQQPFRGKIEETEKSLIDVKELVSKTD
jgi:hypothetical protein